MWTPDDGQLMSGNWRHRPDTLPPQFDLDVDKRGGLIEAQLGICKSLKAGNSVFGLKPWLSAPGQERPNDPTPNAFQVLECNRVDLTACEAGSAPFTTELTLVSRVWRDVINPVDSNPK